MNDLTKGLTYSYSRNIGWQDKAVRIFAGLSALTGSIYFYQSHFILAGALGILFLAQLATVVSSRCMICFFLDRCTIGRAEKRSLKSIVLFVDKPNF
jgi:hypothetical protein